MEYVYRLHDRSGFQIGRCIDGRDAYTHLIRQYGTHKVPAGSFKTIHENWDVEERMWDAADHMTVLLPYDAWRKLGIMAGRRRLPASALLESLIELAYQIDDK